MPQTWYAILDPADLVQKAFGAACTDLGQQGLVGCLQLGSSGRVQRGAAERRADVGQVRRGDDERPATLDGFSERVQRLVQVCVCVLRPRPLGRSGGTIRTGSGTKSHGSPPRM